MATENSIIARLLKRVMHLLLPGIKHDLNCGVKSVHEAIVDLWNAVIETQNVVNKNAEEMESFSAEMKAWAEEFQSKIIASVGGGGTGGDPLGIIGWNNLTKELKDKIEKGLITGGRIERDSANKWWLRLNTASMTSPVVSIDVTGLVTNGIGGADLSGMNFYWDDDACYIGSQVEGDDNFLTIPFANGKDGVIDGLGLRPGIMRAEQAEKLDNFYIDDFGTLHYGNKMYRLQPYKTETGATYSNVAISSFGRVGSTGNIAYNYKGSIQTIVEYSQIKTTQYDDESEENSIVNSGAIITYRVKSGSGASIDANGTINFNTNTGAARTLVFEVTVTLNGKTDTATLSITQNAVPSQDVVYYGSTETYPTNGEQLVNKKNLPLTNNKMDIDQGGKCQWVGVPSGYSIKSWVSKGLTSNITYAEGGNISKDGVTYSVYYYSAVMPPSATTVEIIKN